jgi:hypothetical protein
MKFGLGLGLPAYVTFLSLTTTVVGQSSTQAFSPSNIARQHDHHDAHAQHDDTPIPTPVTDNQAETETETIDTGITSSAILIKPSTAAPAHHAHNPHGGHGHGKHHVPQVELNETDVHYWHHFPASYLAADFRLTRDQVIFGEELDDTWEPEEAGGHRKLAFVHAGLFLIAYFGLLPIGKSRIQYPYTVDRR